MVELSKYTDVFENGTVTSQAGQAIASRHVLHIIAAMQLLVDKKENSAIAELCEANAGQKISAKTIELIGIAAASMFERNAFMTPATAAVINDIVMPPMEAEDYYLVTRHYDAQFNAAAAEHGLVIKWDDGRRPLLNPNSAVA